MSKYKWGGLVILTLIILYFMGPHPQAPVYNKTLPVVPSSPEEVEKFIASKEALHQVRPDNQARIIWASDSSRTKTRYVIVYLHGFSASQAEGDPVHRTVARDFHSNLLLTRLAEHGIDTTEQLVNLTADELWNSAKEAYALAKKLGDSVIVMGTSTGGTLALMLAAAYPDVKAVVLMSPNIAIFEKSARILNDPWGLQIARLITGSRYIYSSDTRPVYKQYWNYGYRLEATVQLEEMLETSMRPEVFREVKQPVLLLYYYKDAVHHDSVVQVDAMKKMYAELGTPLFLKRSVAMPKAGNHVIGSYIKSHDVPGVISEIEKYMREVLGMK